MGDDVDFELFGFWRSMATYRVRVALNLKGLHVRETDLNLDAGDQLAPAFLAVNPEGAVPALVEAGQPAITQSLAILEYLEERYPQVPLLPKDLRGRARVRSLAALVVSDTHPLIVPRVRSYLTTKAGMDDAALRAWSLHWISRGLAATEARLASDPATGEFCHGDQVTFADICLASLVIVARTFQFQPAGAPRLARIVERCETIDAFERAHPLRQSGAPVQSRT